MSTISKTALCLAVLLISGCTANIRETHYFATHDKSNIDNLEPVNFYRLRVAGSAKFSSARYVSGLYDERAVDLFFNEIRTSSSNKSTLFTENLKEPGSDQTITPLSPAVGRGAFVLIMSTDADSVANTIGSFAESQAVASAISNIISTENIKEKNISDARVTIAVNRGIALNSQLSELLTEAQQHDSNAQAAESAYLRVLNALARALGHDRGFTSFNEAREWFQLNKSALGS